MNRVAFAELLEGLVGKSIGESPWTLITQIAVNSFAETTGDHYFIHTDPERARRDGPFPGTIAHGYLTLSLVARLWPELLLPIPSEGLVINYGLDKIRFLAPVPTGSRVRGRFTLEKADWRSENRVITTIAVIADIEGVERPAMAAEMLIMFEF